MKMIKGHDIHSAMRKLRYARSMKAFYNEHGCPMQADAWNAECERMSDIVVALLLDD